MACENPFDGLARFYYEGHEKRLYQRLEPKITHAELFPRGYFGQDSASSQIASTML